MEKIVSKPATSEYRENWDRIFKTEEVDSKSRLKRLAIQKGETEKGETEE